MRSKIVPISLPEALLAQVDEQAKKESRTRSEFFREAVRIEISKRQWESITRYGRAQAKKLGITEADIPRLVKEVREELRTKKALANEDRS